MPLQDVQVLGSVIDHGDLQELDWEVRKYRKPICLECVPPHRAGCQQADYVGKQALWFQWRRQQQPEFDLSDADFWERFGDVPACRCPERLRQLETRDDPLWQASSARVFKLKFGPITAWTWRTMRQRLGRLVVNLRGWPGSDRWDIEPLAAASGNTASEAFERLRVFEMNGRGLTNDGSNR